MYFTAKLFLLFSVVCFGLSLTLHNGNNLLDSVAKISFVYFSSTFFAIAIACIIWGFYFNNSLKRLENVLKHILLVVFGLISIFVFIVVTPFLISLLVIEFFLNLRAKIIDNWINLYMILLILFGALSILLYPNICFTLFVTQNIDLILKEYCNIYINVLSCLLFIIITLSIVESYLLSSCLLWILKRNQDRSKVKHIANIEKAFRKQNSNITDDLTEYMSKKKMVIEEENKKIEDLNNRSIEYIKNSIKRLWLIMLVIVFIIITFDFYPTQYMEYINNYREEINSVLTIYTLTLTYVDKKVTWK